LSRRLRGGTAIDLELVIWQAAATEYKNDEATTRQGLRCLVDLPMACALISSCFSVWGYLALKNIWRP
jgi:hypothetical protein